MLATRSGVIDLRMGNASRYTGATTITDNGVLNSGHRRRRQRLAHDDGTRA